VIVTGVLAATAEVVMLNAADTVAPAATVTVAGTVAAPLLLVNVTVAPPAGAGPFNVTVLPAIGLPPTTDPEVKLTAEGLGGCTVNEPVALTPPEVAVIVTGVLTATAAVVIVNAGDTVCPAATVTEAGTTAAALLLVSVTVTPPAGAAWFRVTVLELTGVPPCTDAADKLTAAAPGGNTVKTAVAVLPL